MLLHTILACTSALRATSPRMNILDSLSSLVGGATASAPSIAFSGTAPALDDLMQSLHDQQTDDERSFRASLESGRLERACALASQRLFDLPEGETPRVTLYRDTAAWCPYCEKVWLTLEEKRVPYTIDKVNMNCCAQPSIKSNSRSPRARLGRSPFL